MPNSLNVLQPEYYAKFRCIGSDCEDTCCAGTSVVIDKETFAKYRACPDTDLKSLMDERVQPDSASTSDQTYALILPTENGCPFLSAERLCSIQAKLGESYLSRSCAVYPRAMSLVDGVLERSLYMSCPEAARLALLNPDGMAFEEVESEPDGPFGGFPELSTSDSASGKPYRHFTAVRHFIISLLQSRSRPVWMRLIILGMFCEELNKIGSAEAEAVPSLIESFTEHTRANLFEETLNNIARQPLLQLTFLIKSLEYRVSSDYTAPRFLDCYRQCLEGIGYSPTATNDDLSNGYTEAYARSYKPFLDTHEYILENYLVNYVFRSLFPFGPQKSAYLDQQSIFAEFQLLTIRYSLLRTLLVGMAGYHKEKFTPSHTIVLIQSFSKAIEHSLPYLKRVRESLVENRMSELPILAFLIKDCD